MIDNEIQNIYNQMTCLNMDHKFRYAITSYPFQQDIREAFVAWQRMVKHLHAIFFREDRSICLHFMSFFHIDMTQVVEILSQVRQELIYSM